MPISRRKRIGKCAMCATSPELYSLIFSLSKSDHSRRTYDHKTILAFSLPRSEVFGYKWPKNEAILNFPFENIWWNIDSYIVAELIESMLRRCLREKKKPFLNVVGPWPVHVHSIWFGSIGVCLGYCLRCYAMHRQNINLLVCVCV